jgi:hypothetical protein
MIDSTAPALQRKMRGRGLTLTHDGGDGRAGRGEAAAGRIWPAADGRWMGAAGILASAYGCDWAPRQPGRVAGRRQLRGLGAAADGKKRRVGEEEEAQRLKVRTTAPWPLAPYLHTPYKNRTAPCLLAPSFLIEFVPRHGEPDVAQDGATSIGVISCTYGTKVPSDVFWVHFCNCFPRCLYVKFLKKDQNEKKLLFSFSPGAAVPSPRYPRHSTKT